MSHLKFGSDPADAFEKIGPDNDSVFLLQYRSKGESNYEIAPPLRSRKLSAKGAE